MNKKKLAPLLALVAVVAVLGVALAALKLTADDGEAEPSIALCSLAAEDVDQISYQDAAQDITLTKGGDGTWTLDSDPALPLDQTAVAAIATDIAGMSAARDLGADADTTGMGFDAPSMTLRISAGDSAYTLTVGAQNTMTGTYYAKDTESDNVYTVETANLSTLCKSPADLYAEQAVTSLVSDDVTAMTVQTAGQTLNFTRTDGTWTLAEDAAYALDQDLVSRMASTVCELQSTWSITAPQANSTYGLDTPNVTVTLVGSDGTNVQCAFGANDPADDSHCYLTSSQAPDVVYEVDSDNLAAYAYTKATLQAATPETAEDASSDVVAEYTVGGANDYTDAADSTATD